MRSIAVSAAVALLLAVCVRAGDASDGASDVVVLTDSSIGAALTANSDKGVLLEFYAPWCGHCKNLAPTYEKVATALKGDVVVAKVDATENKAAAQAFGVKGYPTVVLAKDGKKFEYSGKRTLDALSEFAKNGGEGEGEELEEFEDEGEYTGPDEVVKLTDATFEELTQAATGATTGDWVVMFYAPWCGHCKKLHPTFSRVAAELKGDVNIATLDATENTATARRFNVRGYPTVKMLSNGKQYAFEGKRSKKTILEWATGGFSKQEGEDIPPAPNAWEQIWGDVGAEYEVLKKDISTLMRFKKNALIVVFSAGGVAGVLLAFCMFAGLGGLNPAVEYVQQPVGEQPVESEPVNGAGAGAGAGTEGAPKKKESKKTR